MQAYLQIEGEQDLRSASLSIRDVSSDAATLEDVMDFEAFKELIDMERKASVQGDIDALNRLQEQDIANGISATKAAQRNDPKSKRARTIHTRENRRAEVRADQEKVVTHEQRVAQAPSHFTLPGDAALMSIMLEEIEKMEAR
jgi:hypothetical protein